MTGRRRIIDRRARPRFEVVGELSGTLEIVQPLSIVNVGAGGALIEADRPWDLGSVHHVVVANGKEVGRAQICVKHVNASVEGAFLVGVQFLSITPALASEITRWLALNGEMSSET